MKWEDVLDNKPCLQGWRNFLEGYENGGGFAGGVKNISGSDALWAMEVANSPELLDALAKEWAKRFDYDSDLSWVLYNRHTSGDTLRWLYRIEAVQQSSFLCRKLAYNPNTPASILQRIFKDYYRDNPEDSDFYSILVGLSKNFNTPSTVLRKLVKDELKLGSKYVHDNAQHILDLRKQQRKEEKA